MQKEVGFVTLALGTPSLQKNKQISSFTQFPFCCGFRPCAFEGLSVLHELLAALSFYVLFLFLCLVSSSTLGSPVPLWLVLQTPQRYGACSQGGLGKKLVNVLKMNQLL